MPFPFPEDLPNQGIKLMSLVSPALAGKFFTAAPPGKPLMICVGIKPPQCTKGPHHSYQSFVAVVQLLGCVQLFATPWTTALQAPVPFTISQSLVKLMSIESVMPSNHLILFVPFSSHLQSFPVSGSFPKSQFFTSGDQSIGVSASA